MSTPYEQSGRSGQKQRTRSALVEAACQLVADGHVPTIEECAQRAQISRTTAYRYFPNQGALLAAAHPETAVTSLLPPKAPQDVVKRLDLVVAAFVTRVLETESQQRTMLRLSLQPDRDPGQPLPLRQGRAIGWFKDALEPLVGTMTDDQLHRLALAIRSAVGIEALVWLTDVAGLSRHHASELMQWSARALLHAALDVERPPSAR